MRVIRRNLVYCVGLPPTLSSQSALLDPRAFGQYGKITKVIVNKASGSNGGQGTSAYITFAHALDALCCVLCLDGFYAHSRSVRASYGTSKYCSAFVKGMRCSNPDCTYLHALGGEDDTFSKQEIQSGYVTSGRDRASLIMRPNCRVRVGGGGPSGTGRQPQGQPILPPPRYDEALRGGQGAGVAQGNSNSAGTQVRRSWTDLTGCAASARWRRCFVI